MNKPSQSENFKLSLELLRQAAEKMRDLSIEATPHNYTVWYEYCAGNNSTLVEEIDQLVSQKSRFDEALCERIYSAYFGEGEYEKLRNLRAAIKALIAELGQQVKGIRGNMSAFETSLMQGEEALLKDPDMKALADIIQRLLVETREQKSFANQAVQQVDELNGEIEFLKQSLEQMNEEVFIDALTGIANRKAYDIEVKAALEKSLKYERPMCLVVLDIDYFKRFNDIYGHVIGDRVLRFVATKITANIKGQDFIARYGGEEFVMILPNTDIEGARTITKNILAKIAKAKLKLNKQGEKVNAVTLSAGIAKLNSKDSVESLFDRADQNLLKAKNTGRNMVIAEHGSWQG